MRVHLDKIGHKGFDLDAPGGKVTVEGNGLGAALSVRW